MFKLKTKTQPTEKKTVIKKKVVKKVEEEDKSVFNCESCNGEGIFVLQNLICSDCNGTGRI